MRRQNDLQNNCLKEEQYGVWLRATSRRILNLGGDERGSRESTAKTVRQGKEDSSVVREELGGNDLMEDKRAKGGNEEVLLIREEREKGTGGAEGASNSVVKGGVKEAKGSDK